MNSGSEAVENAVKLIRQGTKRPNILSFENSFHGRTWMAMTLTGKWDPYKVGFGPFVPGVYFTPYAYCYRCPFHSEYPSCGYACVHHIEKNIFKTQVDPSTVGAIIAEPVQGEGGFIAPPPEYFKELKKLADEHGIKMIIDEVQTGFGRTGKMWAIEHYGIEPDIMTIAKAIASGLPLSCVVAKDELMKDTYPGSLGGTYGGNPISCATGLKVLEIIKREKIVEKSAKMGKHLRSKTRRAEGQVRDHRRCPRTRPDARNGVRHRQKIKDAQPRCEQQGHQRTASAAVLMILKAGLYNNCVRLHPPLTIEEDILDTGMDILEKAVKEGCITSLPILISKHVIYQT